MPCYSVSLWRVLVVRSGLVSPSPADVFRGGLCHGLHHWLFHLRWPSLTFLSITLLRRPIIVMPSISSAPSGTITHHPRPLRKVGGIIVFVPRPTSSPSEAIILQLYPTFTIGLRPASSRGAAELFSSINTALKCLHHPGHHLSARGLSLTTQHSRTASPTLCSD